MAQGMTREEFEVFYSFCPEYYDLRGKKTTDITERRKQIMAVVTEGAKCTESSATQYFSLYAAMIEKRTFPKNAIGGDILRMLFEKMEFEFGKDIIIPAINNSYVFFQYRYKF